MNRRRLITGMVALIASPAIVKASSLMAISPLPETTWMTVDAIGPHGKKIPVRMRIDTQRKVRRVEIVEESLPPNSFVWQNDQNELYLMKLTVV